MGGWSSEGEVVDGGLGLALGAHVRCLHVGDGEGKAVADVRLAVIGLRTEDDSVVPIAAQNIICLAAFHWEGGFGLGT